MKWTTNEDINNSLEELRRRNWIIKRGRKSVKAVSPDHKQTITTSLTPSDRRAYMNHISCVRKALKTEAV